MNKINILLFAFAICFLTTANLFGMNEYLRDPELNEAYSISRQREEQALAVEIGRIRSEARQRAAKLEDEIAKERVKSEHYKKSISKLENKSRFYRNLSNYSSWGLDIACLGISFGFSWSLYRSLKDSSLSSEKVMRYLSGAVGFGYFGLNRFYKRLNKADDFLGNRKR